MSKLLKVTPRILRFTKNIRLANSEICCGDVKWNFTLTKGPWYGAIWERLVQSANRCLKRGFGRTPLNLQTVLIEIEAILNLRPLCPLYDDDMEETRTSNHQLFGRKLPQTNVQPVETEINLNRGTKRAHYIDTVVEHYWER